MTILNTKTVRLGWLPIVVIAALLLGVSFQNIFAINPGGGLPPTRISPGSVASAASYIILTDGVTVYAKNGTTGAIETQAADADYVLRNTVQNLTRGGKIYVRAGIYDIDRPIQISNDNVELDFENGATLRMISPFTPDAFGISMAIYINGADHITIDGLTIDGNGITETTELIFISFSDDIDILNLRIHGMGSTMRAIRTRTAERVLVENCHMELAVGATGIYALTAADIVVSNCFFRGFSNTSGGPTAILIGPFSGGKIVMNAVVENSFFENLNIGIQIAALRTENSSVIIRNNQIRNTSIAIYAFGPKNIITGNDMFNVTTGVRTDGWLNNSVIAYNTIADTVDNCISKPEGSASYIRVLIQGNILRNCAFSGIALFVTAGQVIQDVMIKDNIVIDAGEDGIEINSARVSNVTIEGNSVIGSANFGITLLNSPLNITIRNNYLRENTLGPLSLTGVNHVVEGNFGYVTELCSSTASIADADTITHGLAGTPTSVIITGTNSSMIIAVSSVGATTFVVNMVDHAGVIQLGAGGDQTIYWCAKFKP